jgi:putative NADH-flavin reductase
MATLALIGATGFVGGAVLNEALARGHQVRALARHPFKLATRPRLEVVQADVLVPSQVILGLHGADAVISAYNSGWKNPEQYDEFLQATRALYAGARHAGVKRLLVVGGAGSLFVAPGVQLVDTPQFPAHIKPGALAARDALELLRAEYSLDWTFLSPPPLLLPQDRQGHGERTGSYRVGEDAPLAGHEGYPSSISAADLAVAILDEIEQPRHIRRRFTVAN